MGSIDSLITNKWEFYDVVKMRRKKLMVIVPLAAILWFMFFMLVNLFASLAGYDDIPVKLLVSTIIFLVVMAIVMLKIGQMDRDKLGWYFAAVDDQRLDREQVLGFIKGFLEKRRYTFVEASTHRTMTLWITYFDIPGTDFKLRLWYSMIGGVPVVEIGFGPETLLNKKLLEQLRTEMSADFGLRFGFVFTAGHWAIPATSGGVTGK